MLESADQHVGADPSSADDDDDDDKAFFHKKKQDSSSKSAVDQYLHSTSEDICSISTWPHLKDLFLRLNAPLPASAAVERLFSLAGLIMAHKRTRMTDKHFENLAFLKANKWISDV
jgi:hypothetical protein